VSLTLQEARVLSRAVENGVCPDDSRVADRINEAVARIHALGAFVGTVARYGVTVDATTGEFELPPALGNILRASRLADGMNHSPTGTFITDNEYAFVLESSPVLSLQQLSPTRFRVLGPVLPSAVDVMGKKKLTPAVQNSDPLAVDDLPAIKLMLLALFREENNQLDLAGALQKNCVDHLTLKTQTAVGEARRVLATSMAAGMAEGTLGYARAKLALALTGGIRVDDHELVEIVSEAERRLMQQGREWRSYLLKVRGGEIALPQEMDAILTLSVENRPVPLRSQWFDFLEAGWGYREGAYSGRNAIYRGERATHTLPPEAGVVAVLADANEQNLRVRIEGRSALGNPLVSNLTLNGAQLVYTQETYSEITSITKDYGRGNVFFTVDGTEVAALSAAQTESRAAIYAIPSDENCEDKSVRVIVRPRWTLKVQDTDRLQLNNIPALTAMAMSILAERNGDKEGAEVHEARALRYYEAQFANKEFHHSRRIQIQTTGFGGSSFKSIR